MLIGDATHATGPVWPQGAAVARENALVLAEVVGTAGPALGALAGMLVGGFPIIDGVVGLR